MSSPSPHTAADLNAAREQVAERLLPLVETLPPGVLAVAVLQVAGGMLATHWATGKMQGPLGPQLDAAHQLMRHAFDGELMRMRREFPATRGRA